MLQAARSLQAFHPLYVFQVTVVRCLLALSIVATPAWSQSSAEVDGQTSALWGESGEKWSPTSRLPDFSWAGYHAGAKPIPDVPDVADVRDFGAVGDGETDDTEAILEAIASTEDGAVFFPEGRYVLSDVIEIKRSGIVLRGEGPDKTTLVIPKSLMQVRPVKNFTAQGVMKSPYSFGRGFVEWLGTSPKRPKIEVTAPSKRGDNTITVADGLQFEAGNLVQVWVQVTPEFGRYLHGDLFDVGEETREKKPLLFWAATATKVDGNTLTLDRPLRFDIRDEWDVTVRRYEPTVRECGIENLTFEFPGTPKPEHLMEEGFNAIWGSNAMNCWVRNVRIIDSDNAIVFRRCLQIQVENIEIISKERSDPSGHHALWVASSTQDCLFQNFSMNTEFHHDISVESFATGNVFRMGRGPKLNFDHHRIAPYENLFTNIHTDDVSRLWESSGRGDRGPHGAARPTFWNIRYESGELNYRKPKGALIPDWPLINIIGLAGAPAQQDENGAWVEPLDKGVTPPDLFIAQRERRLKQKTDVAESTD